MEKSQFTGDGTFIKETEKITCPECRGRGRESCGHKLFRKSRPCDKCDGKGYLIIVKK